MMEYELTEDEKNALESLKQFSKRIDNVPAEKKIPVSNPDKYNFPIYRAYIVVNASISLSIP